MSNIREAHLPPLVSIIVSVYRNSHHMMDTIKSVLRQTHPSFELIVVVDGGECPYLNEVLATKNCVVVSIPKSGVSVARNTGLLESKGTYCLFLDHDDILHPSMIATLVEKLEFDQSIGACACGIQHITDSLNLRYENDSAVHVSNIGPTNDPWTAAKVVGKRFIVPSSILYRRSTLARTGMFNPSYPFTGDFELLINCVQFFQVCLISANLTFYRVHSDNFSKQYEIGLSETIQLCKRLSIITPRYGFSKSWRQYRKQVGASNRTFAYQALDVARHHWQSRNVRGTAYHLMKSITLDLLPTMNAILYVLKGSKSS